MKQELDEALCAAYPKIFADRHKDMRYTAMCWGFSHGDGWYDILNVLCRKIQGHIDWQESQRKLTIEYNEALKLAKQGDTTKLYDYYKSSYKNESSIAKMVQQSLDQDEREVPSEIPQVVAVQVKEKFGTLRFYYDGGDEYISGLVTMAEWASSVTCETCGERGKIRGGGWLYTACDKHTRPEDLVKENENAE